MITHAGIVSLSLAVLDAPRAVVKPSGLTLPAAVFEVLADIDKGRVRHGVSLGFTAAVTRPLMPHLNHVDSFRR